MKENIRSRITEAKKTFRVKHFFWSTNICISFVEKSNHYTHLVCSIVSFWNVSWTDKKDQMNKFQNMLGHVDNYWITYTKLENPGRGTIWDIEAYHWER